MRPGGGKDKGSQAERLVGLQLSKWITKGEKGDLFARNVLSGGQFTRFRKKGMNASGQPGDLIANNELAFPFLRKYSVEVKHYADLQWDAFIYDTKRKSFLWGVVIHTSKQAEEAGRRWLVVAKQNMKDTVILMDEETALDAFNSTRNPYLVRHHAYHNGAVHSMSFAGFLKHVSYEKFIAKGG